MRRKDSSTGKKRIMSGPNVDTSACKLLSSPVAKAKIGQVWRASRESSLP